MAEGEDLPEIDLVDKLKAKRRRYLFKLKTCTSRNKSLITFTMIIVWILSVLLAIIISLALEKEYMDNSPNKVIPVEGTQGVSTESSVFTYAVSYSTNKTQSVTLELLTQNSNVWAIGGDCIVIDTEPIVTYNQTLVNLEARRFEAAFYKEGMHVPLFALAHSSLLYNITAVSENKNGCVFFYFFNTKEALEEFLQSDNSDNFVNIQGYYNRSDDCIGTDGIPHDAFFSINVTGETFVGIAVNVSANITYTLKGMIVEYNTSTCTQDNIYNLTYNTPLKIDICKSSFCALMPSNETIIVINSKEQGVLIHWDPKPLELTLVVWIIIFIMAGLAIITFIVFSLYFAVKCLCKISKKCKKNKGKQLHELKDETKEIIKVLIKVLESCYDNLSTLFTKDKNKIAGKMFENGIITPYLRDDIVSDATPSDAIIVCFKGRLKLMDNQIGLENHCSRFIKSIKEMEDSTGKWKKLAMAVENRWKNAIEKKLNIKFEIDVNVVVQTE